MILDMCPDCQNCGRDLPPDSREARICSFECTFCAACADGAFGGICPNCGGDLVVRPTRAERWLDKYPASTVRKGPR
jgi:hypothetical protein